jgi:hypothetical protein
MVSWSTTTPSKIFLPGIKADWEGLITLWAILVTQFLPTFVNTLKLTLRGQIGQYCSIRLASYFFGNKVMTPKLILNKGSSPVLNWANIAIISPLITSQNFW